MEKVKYELESEGSKGFKKLKRAALSTYEGVMGLTSALLTGTITTHMHRRYEISAFSCCKACRSSSVLEN